MIQKTEKGRIYILPMEGDMTCERVLRNLKETLTPGYCVMADYKKNRYVYLSFSSKLGWCIRVRTRTETLHMRYISEQKAIAQIKRSLR